MVALICDSDIIVALTSPPAALGQKRRTRTPGRAGAFPAPSAAAAAAAVVVH